jgi:Flagellar P-ring protein
MHERKALLGFFLMGLVGCIGPFAHSKDEPVVEKPKEIEVKTIGKVASVENTAPVEVFGIGLVVGLDGTGGGAPPGPYRSVLEDQLPKENKIDNPKQFLASNTTSLVLVSARIPAGARKDDIIDVNITVPKESRTTSLRGGRLLRCHLYDYSTKKGLSPNYKGLDVAVRGKPVAKAEGTVSVGFGDGDEQARLRVGRIWGGGRCAMPRPLYLIMNTDSTSASITQKCAERINETFNGVTPGSTTELAKAMDKRVVYINVPPQYKLNLPHFIRVVRLIPLYQTADADRIAYSRQLEEKLMDPTRSIQAALRLEALGPDSIPTLKHGLASEHSLVRFTSAEALAYLGNTNCGEVLAKTARDQPALRAFCLTALASLDESVSHVELRGLLSQTSAETRYGAFHALHSLEENDEAIRGELLNGSFSLHRVAPESAPLVHLATITRAEVVIFGEEPVMNPPFPILAGEFTVTAKEGDDRCTITHASLRSGKTQKQCSLKLEDVIRTMAQMGALYPDIVELLRRADSLQCLSCQVAVDAIPQLTEVYDLAKAAAAGDKELLKTDEEILAARAEFGANPTLFEQTARTSANDKETEAVLSESIPAKMH